MLEFSPIIVGTMRLGSWGANMDTQSLERFIDECVDMGLVDFDHADIYGHYTEEARFGEVLRRRKDLVNKLRITTKCGIKLVTENRPSHALKSYDLSKAHILASVDQSLKDLGVEQVELLLLHRPDSLMNPHEVAEAFEQIRSAGKIKHFGVSNYSTSQFDLLNSFTPLVTNQVELSLLQLDALYDGTLDQSLRLGLKPTVWSPFGGGKIFQESDDEQVQRVQETAKALAEKYNAGVDQILLAWIFKHPANIVPVVGSSKTSRIKSALEAKNIQLTHQEWYMLLESSIGNEVP
ncbi:MAG: aldo/keto reductase [Bacteroidia bacterium]|nr:aldo/keto reductase [Bacteroidia bacterium]